LIRVLFAIEPPRTALLIAAPAHGYDDTRSFMELAAQVPT
jgi:hypothetical protein